MITLPLTTEQADETPSIDTADTVEIPPEDALPSAPSRQVRFWEMIFACNDEALRLKTVQSAMVKCGIATAPHAGRMDRALVFAKTAETLLEIDPIWPEVRALLIKERKKSRQRR